MSAVAVASHEFSGVLRCGVHWAVRPAAIISFQALTAIHYTHRLAAYFVFVLLLGLSIGFTVCRPFDRMPAGLQA
jgi:heme A synthase